MGWVDILDKVARKGLFEKVTFELRKAKNILGGGNGRGKALGWRSSWFKDNVEAMWS
jgi:hypothetical protein